MTTPFPIRPASESRRAEYSLTVICAWSRAEKHPAARRARRKDGKTERRKVPPAFRPSVFPSFRPSVLLVIELPPRIQIVEVHDRVQHERITPDRLPAIHGIDREEHQVPLPPGRVDHDRPIRDLAASLEQAGDQEVALRREAEHHARPLVRRGGEGRSLQLPPTTPPRLPGPRG